MRARKRRQLGFVFRSHGGARAGAGRPPKGNEAGVSHLERPRLSPHHPVHVTLRVTRSVPPLRTGKMYKVVERALAAARERSIRLVHFSVQRDHLHLLVEASDRRALSRGMQGLCIRVAKAINRRVARRGSVFADRYHARSLKTPREARHALRYVLLNALKHGRGGERIPVGFVDPCSSARWFEGWRRPSELAFVAGRRPREGDAPVVGARTWLLRAGWRRAGPIDVDDRPGGAH